MDLSNTIILSLLFVLAEEKKWMSIQPNFMDPKLESPRSRFPGIRDRATKHLQEC